MHLYSDEELLEHLRKLAKKLGRTPYKKEIKEAGSPCAYTYYLRFGTLSRAEELAGLVPFKVKIRQSKFTDEYLLNHLKELAQQLGRTPYYRDINEAGKVKDYNYMNRFGNITNAAKAAGLAPNTGNNVYKYSNENLLSYLKELSKQLGKTPTSRYLNKAGKIGASIYIHRFGSLRKAQKAAGLVPNKRGHQQEYTNKYLLTQLKELASTLGRTPSLNDIDESGKVKYALYTHHFGNLSKALKAAGLEANRRGRHCKYTDEYLLNHLKELAATLGKTPTINDIKREGKISYDFYRKLFGSFSTAQRAAGLVPDKRGRQQQRSQYKKDRG